MSTLAGVLLLVTIVGGLIALAFSPKVKKWMQKMISPYEEGETFDGESARERAPRGTVLYSREELRVEQLLDHHKTTSFPIRLDEKKGDGYVYISGPTASASRAECEKNGDILLARSPYVATVSALHLGIAKDDQGFFLFDNSSTNGTVVVKEDGTMVKLMAKAPFQITDGLTVYLGSQPIRFIETKIGLPTFDDGWGGRAKGSAADGSTRVDFGGGAKRERTHVHR